jgi:hypothetical protein
MDFEFGWYCFLTRQIGKETAFLSPLTIWTMAALSAGEVMSHL